MTSHPGARWELHPTGSRQLPATSPGNSRQLPAAPGNSRQLPALSRQLPATSRFPATSWFPADGLQLPARWGKSAISAKNI